MKFKKTIGVLLLVSIMLGMMALPTTVSGAEISPAQEYLDKQMEDYNVNGVAYITKNGKVKRAHAFKSHILAKKSTKRKRGLRKAAYADKTNVAQIKLLVPYK